MQKTNIAFGTVFTGIGLLFLFVSLRYGIASPTSDGVPGAGFFPFLVSALVVLLGIALIALSLLHRDGQPSPFHMDKEQRENILPFALTIIAIFAFFALWRLIPFEWAALAFCLFMNRAYGRSWRFNILFSVIFVFSIHYIFNRLLFVQFEI